MKYLRFLKNLEKENRQQKYINEKNKKPEGVPIELADVIIRCFDMADYYEIDLEKAIVEKMNFNKDRPYKHGKLF